MSVSKNPNRETRCYIGHSFPIFGRYSKLETSLYGGRRSFLVSWPQMLIQELNRFLPGHRSFLFVYKIKKWHKKEQFP